jgi:hypothetical protein
MAPLLEAQLIARPVSTLLLASRVVAVACVVWPGLRLLAARETLTEATATGGADDTVIVALPLRPSLVAVISADPTAAAVTRPDVDTVATELLVELQVTARPVRTLLLASRVVAVA